MYFAARISLFMLFSHHCYEAILASLIRKNWEWDRGETIGRSREKNESTKSLICAFVCSYSLLHYYHCIDMSLFNIKYLQKAFIITIISLSQRWCWWLTFLNIYYLIIELSKTNIYTYIHVLSVRYIFLFSRGDAVPHNRIHTIVGHFVIIMTIWMNEWMNEWNGKKSHKHTSNKQLHNNSNNTDNSLCTPMINS